MQAQSFRPAAGSGRQCGGASGTRREP
jgi:hypothetical protein